MTEDLQVVEKPPEEIDLDCRACGQPTDTEGYTTTILINDPYKGKTYPLILCKECREKPIMEVVAAIHERIES